MIKGIKITFIVAGALVLLGILLIVISTALGGSMQASTNWEKKEFEISAQTLESIEIGLRDRELVIEQAQGAPKVTYYVSERDKCDVAQTAGELIISDSNYRTSWLRELWDTIFMQKSAEQRTLVITIPRDAQISINAVCDNGKVEMKDLAKLTTVDIKTANGRASFGDITAGTLKFESSNGDITLNNINCESLLSIDTRNGRITTDTIQSKDALDIKTSNGDIVLSGDTMCASIDLKSSNGNLKFDSLTATDITMNTSNGNIIGTINGNIGDYTIKSDTSNGKNSLPQESASSAPGLITVKTWNGNIDVKFAK